MGFLPQVGLLLQVGLPQQVELPLQVGFPPQVGLPPQELEFPLQEMEFPQQAEFLRQAEFPQQAGFPQVELLHEAGAGLVLECLVLACQVLEVLWYLVMAYLKSKNYFSDLCHVCLYFFCSFTVSFIIMLNDYFYCFNTFLIAYCR